MSIPSHFEGLHLELAAFINPAGRYDPAKEFALLELAAPINSAGHHHRVAAIRRAADPLDDVLFSLDQDAGV